MSRLPATFPGPETIDALPRDGVIELVAAVDEGGLYLQGWGHRLPTGPIDLWVETTDQPVRRHGVAATFPRQDAGPDACGILILLTDGPAAAPDTLKRVVFATADGACLRLDLFSRRRILPTAEVPKLLKGLIPRLTAGVEVLVPLRRVASGGFTGTDTIASLGVPIRFGLDEVVRLAAGGVVLAGWLADPVGWVVAIGLRETNGRAIDLTSLLIWLPRPERPGAAANDPGASAAGFLVSLPAEAFGLGDCLYLELRLNDGSLGFCPVFPTPIPALESARRLAPWIAAAPRERAAELVDLLMPLLAPVRSRRPTAASPLPALAPNGRRPGISVLLPDADDDVDVILAGLATDPAAERLEVLIAVPALQALTRAVALGQLARLYRLPIRPIPIEASDRAQALNLAAAAADAETLLILTGALLPGPAGWIESLSAASAGVGGAAVSPTLLHEDGSIAFAGWQRNQMEVGAPLISRFHGYPEAWLAHADAANPALDPGGITLDCCLLPRRAFDQAGGCAEDYLSFTTAAADFTVRLDQAGIARRWLPAPALVLASASGQLPSERWRDEFGRFDRPRFEHRWGERWQSWR